MKKIAIAVIIVLSFAGGKYAFDALFADKEKASFDEDDWKHRIYLGVAFESPFELSSVEVNLPEAVKQRTKLFSTYKYELKACAFFVSVIEFTSDIPIDLDNAVKGAIRNMKAGEEISDFTSEVNPVTKWFLEGRKITGKMKVKGKDAEFTAELYKKDSRMLQILWSNLDYPENREVRDRIFNTMNATL
ncbi:MAG: hypothetical protein C0412_12825 [Flavobacterium sp.]|nr:hypothetical protein [Flavobacterium sp.]